MTNDQTTRSPDHWRKIDQILDALAASAPAQQTEKLNQLCAGDAVLRKEVETLLAAQQNAGSFRETSSAEATKIFAPPPALLGQQLGRYQIESLLGEGGMGAVYLARDTQLHQRRVVIKVLLEVHAASMQDPWFQKKFAQEIEALVRIDHPGVVGVLDAGTLPDGKLFFVMQFVEGVTLRAIMKEAPLDFQRASRLVRQIGQALSAAHDKGVIHRDLKPENIMVQTPGEEEETVKLIDFGIATVKDSQAAANAEKTVVAGTLPYMAPEQFRGQPVPASDIWALGVIAYELLTGRLPFQAETMVQLHDLQRAGVSVRPRQLRPDLSSAAQATLLKALAFEPSERYSRARDFGDELARALAREEKATLAEAATTISEFTSEEKTMLVEPAATTTPLAPEMAHILFMDLVGYSKLPTDEQVQQQQILHQRVQQTKEFRRAQQQNQLISLPTGDGMALVFFGDPMAPVQCAIELAQFLRTQPEIALRMGVHSGLVYRVADINANRNVAGGGINIAQRVMDCGDAGHILISSTVAGVLGEAGHWGQHLTDWGEQEVKHGARIHLYNLYTGEVGKPDLPEKLRRTVPLIKPTTGTTKAEPKKLPMKWLVAGVSLLLILAVSLWFWQRPTTPPANQANVITAPQTLLSYSLRTRPNPDKNPNAKEESLPGEINFTPGDEMRVSFVSAQDGYFYLVNEGPQPVNGLPRYNLLYPALQPGYSTSPTLRANQPLHIPQERPPWFRVDAEQGTETLWLIWSKRSISEMETVRKWLNAKDGGEIKDATEIKLVQEFLNQHSLAAKPIAEKDEQQTNLKGSGDGLLIYKMVLNHR